MKITKRFRIYFWTDEEVFAATTEEAETIVREKLAASLTGTHRIDFFQIGDDSETMGVAVTEEGNDTDRAAFIKKDS